MDVYRFAKEECSCNATMFLRMLYEHGGIETAHRLLGGKAPQCGFTKLWACGCLDKSVECLVLDPGFQRLPEDHELDTARRRLRQCGFDPESCDHIATGTEVYRQESTRNFEESYIAMVNTKGAPP